MLFLVHLGIRERTLRREVLTAELVTLEINKVKELLTTGIVLHAWKRTDAISIVLLIEALSDPGCRAVLAALPFSMAGILDIQMIVPVEPYLDVYPDQGPE